MKTYQDHLREKGLVDNQSFLCPECGGKEPSFAIVEASSGRWICSTCHINEQREAQLAADEAAKAALDPWDTEEANSVRAHRTRLQESWRWSVMPDSPLHEDARNRAMAYLKLLNTLTIDYTSPENVIWPVEPTFTSEDYDAADA